MLPRARWINKISNAADLFLKCPMGQLIIIIIIIIIIIGNAIPVTGREDPQGFETWRLPHFLDNRLTNGGKVFSLRRRTLSSPRKFPGTHFC
jgi:hypothetical protein